MRVMSRDFSKYWNSIAGHDLSFCAEVIVWAFCGASGEWLWLRILAASFGMFGCFLFCAFGDWVSDDD